MNAIRGFKGEYRWLSNFYPCNITMFDFVWPTAEHAYVAAKFRRIDDSSFEEGLKLYCKLAALTPGQAKRMGREATLPPNWDQYKIKVMEKIIELKFSCDNKDLMQKLIATGDAYIEETNSWGDEFWGVNVTKHGSAGQNMLGKIIMSRRSEINEMKQR